MKHRIAVAAIAAAALVAVACQDQDGGARRLATEPGSTSPEQGTRYVTTGVAAVVDRVTHRLQAVAPSSPSASASVVAANGSPDAVTISNGAPGIANSGGQRISSFVDASSHRHTVSMLYSSVGGPPAAVQHYVDGVLVSTNAFSWQRTSTGWVRTGSLLRVVRKGTLVGTYTTVTTPAPVGKGGGSKPTLRLQGPVAPTALQRAIGSAAYHLAFVFAPQDATAQSLAWSACSQFWLRYAAAAAVVVGLEVAMADMPVITAFILAQFGSALSLLAAAEDQLLDCVLSHQPSSTDNWSSGMGSGAGSGAGGGSDGTKDCLQGSYAAHCTTAFTL